MLNVPITPPRVKFIDERNGNVSREWYMFFLSLLDNSGVSLDELQKGPPSVTIDDMVALIPEDVSPESGVLEQVAELSKQIQGIMQAPPQQLQGEPIARYQRTLSWLTIAH